MITGIISITIGAVMLASVFISSIKGYNRSLACYSPGNCTTAWTTGEIAMWGLLTLVGIVGLLYGVLSVFGLA